MASKYKKSNDEYLDEERKSGQNSFISVEELQDNDQQINQMQVDEENREMNPVEMEDSQEGNIGDIDHLNKEHPKYLQEIGNPGM
eukprot:CAMPEP_0170550204 /NCGR_PEP_ID=MMETSP0211-20121228/8275_1 /TAXON_ID=311385 /ORGANISM="Pseudokeronopsis sp., Strain OXSARD2" /LENGTH=84 /DNA_ID=CAMNT_0010856623 /DNA_START=973 /DNA_END=1224 /DNA_ORIENTATION=-